MAVVQVGSSAISQVEYHGKKHILDIYFTDGDIRSYKVPYQVYKAFMEAKSKGTYFNYNIRDIYPQV